MRTDPRRGELPHWDMTVFFPSLDAPELDAACRELREAVGSLRDDFEAEGIHGRGEGAVDASTAERFERLTDKLNDVLERSRTLNAYVRAFVATDSRDDVARARQSELERDLVEIEKLGTRYRAWVGSLDTDALVERSGVARAHAFVVRKARTDAAHQMSEGEEDLAAGLSPAGVRAWTRLHGELTSRLTVSVPHPGGDAEELPMSAVRGLARHSDPATREAAYRAELGGWEQAAVPLAAAMNGIKGWEHTLNERRGWADALEPVLHRNNVDRATLDAMQGACVEAFGDLRGYLQAKARLLGREGGRLPWWDLFAPVEGATRQWSFAEAASFITERFAGYSDALAGVARRAFAEDWIDAEPRVGKRDGGFCMPVRGDESRILVNYEPSFGSVSTVAHELGHAYHNTRLARRPALRRLTPMALAETASIFCQTLVLDAMLAEADASERLAILESDLQHTCQIIVDIHSRFLFEQSVFEARARRELSVAELNERMVEAQASTYGEGIDHDTLHPYMWAVKPHYYSTSFYNWPYTFGLLFGLGLYARFREDPDGFRARYDELLASTGDEDAAGLAGRFGIDVRSKAFWASSLDVVRDRVAEFERLTGRYPTARART